MKILGINGSHNKNGNCAYMLELLMSKMSAKGYETEILSAHDAVTGCKTPFCVSCSSPCNKSCYGKELSYLFEQMKDADAVVFASPVYFGTMSAQMKCLFDKTRDARANKLLFGKIGVAMSCGASKYGGQETTVRAIHDCMLVNGMTVIGTSSQIGAGHQGVCAHKPAENDDFAKERIEFVAHRIDKELCKSRV